MLKVASMVFHNRDQEEEEHALGKEKHKEKRQAQLPATLQGQRPMVPWNEEPKALLLTIAINSGSPDTRKGNALEMGLLETVLQVQHWKRDYPKEWSVPGPDPTHKLALN